MKNEKEKFYVVSELHTSFIKIEWRNDLRGDSLFEVLGEYDSEMEARASMGDRKPGSYEIVKRMTSYQSCLEEIGGTNGS